MMVPLEVPFPEPDTEIPVVPTNVEPVEFANVADEIGVEPPELVANWSGVALASSYALRVNVFPTHFVVEDRSIPLKAIVLRKNVPALAALTKRTEGVTVMPLSSHAEVTDTP